MNGLPMEHTHLLARASKVCALALVGGASIALLGWQLRVAVLTSLAPGFPEMKANCAVGLILCGLAIWARVKYPGGYLCPFVSVLVAILGAGTLLEYATGHDFGIDQFLITDELFNPGEIPGRMSVNSSILFILFGTAGVSACRNNRASDALLFCAGTLGMLGAYLSVIGYVYGLSVHYPPPATTPISLPSSILFILAFAGMTVTKPGLGWTKLLLSSKVDGHLARFFVPASLLALPVVGWVCLQGERLGYYHARTGLALFTMASIILLLALVWISAQNVAKLAASLAERSDAQAVSEANLRALADNANVGILVFTGAKIVFANSAIARLLGYSSAELAGMRLANSIYADDKGRAMDRNTRWAAGGEVEQRYEVRLVAKDGHIIPVEVNAAVTRWDGIPARVAFVSDISTRRRLEEDLRRGEAQLNAGEEIAQLGSWSYDVATETTFWSDGFWRIFGVNAKTAESNPTFYRKHIHEDDREALTAAQADLFATGKPGIVSYRFVMPDGRIKHIEARGRGEFDSTGRLVRLHGTLQDITERIEAEEVLRRNREALAEAQQQYVDLFEFSPDGLVLTTRDGEIVLMNQQAEHIFGWKRAELVGQPVEVLIPQTARRRHVALREDFATSSSRRQMAAGLRSLRGRRKDGTEFPVEIDLAPVTSKHGFAVAAVVRDVTEQRALEEQLAHATKMEAIGKLTGGMAHDFNNYLGVIIGNLDMLKASNDFGRGAAGFIDSALNGALHATELTQSLLAFARMQPLTPKVTALDKPITDTTDLLRHTLGEQITIKVTLAADLWPVLIDVAQLESCIINLATNARDAMPSGGELGISARNVTLDEVLSQGGGEPISGQFVLLEVSDIGTGMSPEVMAQAFEPFFSTKATGHGTGLGLSMVYGFVRQSGGHTRIESAVGYGTVVRIYLPRAVEPAATATDEQTTRALITGTESVLLVEDNEMMREAVKQQLASLGYHVIEAENGEAALAILGQLDIKVDILFTDVVMPWQLDGRELARRGVELRSSLKVLLTSGFPGKEGSLGGKFALLAKPYRLEGLARAIRDALDATSVVSAENHSGRG